MIISTRENSKESTNRSININTRNVSHNLSSNENEYVYPDLNHLLACINGCHSHTTIATTAFIEVFKEEINDGSILSGDYIVYSRSSNHSKKSLDKYRIEFLHKFCIDKFDYRLNAKEGWSQCVEAINKII